MRVLCIVQSRFSSSRLPGKALYPLKGVPMICFLLRRLASMNSSSVHLCLATTMNPEDDILAQWGSSEGIRVIRGDENDVLSRFIQSVDYFEADACVRITGDNPLTSREMIASTVRELAAGHDYVDGYSLAAVGTGIDGFSRGLLHRLWEMELSSAHREHINLKVLEHPSLFDCKQAKCPTWLQNRDMSLTVDTLSDFNKVTCLLSQIDLPIESISARHVLS